MTDSKQTMEDSFRESLQDVITIAEKLAPVCKTVEEMIGIAQLALENPGQLRLLLKEITPKK